MKKPHEEGIIISALQMENWNTDIKWLDNTGS